MKNLITVLLLIALAIYSLVSKQYLIIPFLIGVAVALYYVQEGINFLLFIFDKLFDKGQVKYLPLLGTDLSEEQKEYILYRLKKVERLCKEPELFVVSEYASNLIHKILRGELNEKDIEIINKLMNLRMGIKIFQD
ncbi:MAG: hypothetical protein N2645_17730 [Clostridia bacterium]|nr:hypothetical protein [Clostridia bacterium]